MTDRVASEIRELVADVFGLEPDELPHDASSETLEEWDSLRHLDVVMALEHRFATSFSPDEIVGMRSIDGIHRVLSAKKLV